jgi:hypothetical protein
MKIHNRKYHRIIASALILLVLMTSVSFTIDRHYCEGELQNINILGKAQSCQAANSTKEVYCPIHEKMMKMDEGKSCCENKVTFVKADNDLVDIDFKIPTTLHFQQFVVAYVLAFHANIHTETQPTLLFSYQPPMISRDICVLSSTFLL